MLLWTVMGVDVVVKADGRRVILIQLSDRYSDVSVEMDPSEAATLRGQVEQLLKSNPGTTRLQVNIAGNLYEIDSGSAGSLLTMLPSDRSRALPLIVAAGLIAALLAAWGASSYLISRNAI